MTADLDLSPEAVERLAKRHALHVSSKYPTAATLRALSAENTRLRAERDEQRERAEEAESEITRAQEQVSAEFEGDCWKAIHNLLERTGFDWSEYSEDGVSASEAQRWIVEELDRLEAERDAAWQAGAEAMREEIAQWTVVYGFRDPLEIAYDIRALPLPGQPNGAAPPFQASTLEALLSVATDDEADAIRSAARRANIEVPE